MSEIVSREIRLKQRPVGIPKESDFEIVEVTVAEPKAGEVLVRNIYMSVDPYMRGVVRNAALGVPLEGGCVGQVVQFGERIVSGWRLCIRRARLAGVLPCFGREPKSD